MINQLKNYTCGFYFIFFSACVSGGINSKKDNFEFNNIKRISSITPEWVLGRGHQKYPSFLYMTGVGFSNKNALTANDFARAELAKTFMVRVHSFMEDVVSYQNKRRRLNLKIESQVDAFLEGVEIKDGWFDSKTYYSFAVLKRSIASKAILEKYTRLSQRAKERLRNGNEAYLLGLWREALVNYSNGYEDAVLAETLPRAYRIVSGGKEMNGKIYQDPSLFTVKIDSLAKDLILVPFAGNNQKVRIEGGSVEPIVVNVRRKSDDKPLAGIPISFSFEQGTGKIESKGVTGLDGMTETHISNLGDGKHFKVVAKIDYESILEGLDPEVITRWVIPVNQNRVRFDLFVKSPPWNVDEHLSWKEGLTNLVNSLVIDLPSNKDIKIGISEFKDLRDQFTKSFGNIIKEDMQTILAKIGDLSVVEIDGHNGKNSEKKWPRQNRLDYYFSGSYRMEKNSFEIKGKLIDTNSGRVVSVGHVSISRSEIHPDDMNLFDSDQKEKKFFSSIKNTPLKYEAKEKNESFNEKYFSTKKELKLKKDIPGKVIGNTKKPGSIELKVSANLSRGSKKKLENTNNLTKKRKNKIQDTRDGQNIVIINDQINKYLSEKNNLNKEKLKDQYKKNRWVNFHNGTVFDNQTGLTWMKSDFANIMGRAPESFMEAWDWVKHVNSKGYAGFDDWRLPVVDEYKKLFDPERKKVGRQLYDKSSVVSRSMPAKPVGYPIVFDDGGGYWYWTAESVPCDKQVFDKCYRVFNFRDGITGVRSINVTDLDYSSVRLVRDDSQ